jgi:hypothetical protein
VNAPPRLYCIPATAADVVAVVRRGPTAWCRLGRWDVAAGTYEPGAWLRGTIYPERCDLSPDGRYFAYFALKASARWDIGATYIAISRLPELTAVAAWSTCGTWTRGIHFVADPSVCEVTEPEHGALPPDLGAGVAVTRAAAYPVERRRGWFEAPGSAPQPENDPWDIGRAEELRMQRQRPGGGATLEVQGGYGAFRNRGYSATIAYRVGDAKLTDVNWADWSRDGRLLVGTTVGTLETRDQSDWNRPAAIVADLSHEQPEPGRR